MIQSLIRAPSAGAGVLTITCIHCGNAYESRDMLHRHERLDLRLFACVSVVESPFGGDVTADVEIHDIAWSL